MRKCTFVCALLAVLLITLASGSIAQAQDSTSVRSWALGWEQSAKIAFWPYAFAKVALLDLDSIISVPRWEEGTQASDAEWLAYGRRMRGWAHYYRERYSQMWRHIVRPRVLSEKSWLPLARWLCWKDDESEAIGTDARTITRYLRQQYGERPVLKRPVSTMRRLYREWFADHPHASLDDQLPDGVYPVDPPNVDMIRSR